MIQAQNFLLKRIETKSAKDCALLLKEYAKKHGDVNTDEKWCPLHAIYNGDCNDDLLDYYLNNKHTSLMDKEAIKIVMKFKELTQLERKSALAIYANEDCIEVRGEKMIITESAGIREQDNQYFSITHNKELNCYDLVFKQPKYDTSAELLGIMSFVHQLGVRNPNETLRIGAMIENVV